MLSWLKTSQPGICFLQGTHLVETDEVNLTKEWGVMIFYSHGKFNAQRVAIFIPPELKDQFEYVN